MHTHQFLVRYVNIVNTVGDTIHGVTVRMSMDPVLTDGTIYNGTTSKHKTNYIM